MRTNAVTEEIIAAAIHVHRALGPGLLESAYEACMEHELVVRGMLVSRQVPLPLCYRGVVMNVGYRIDLLVEDQVVVELKSVDTLTDLHSAQTISYMRLSGKPAALLINFNAPLLKNGLRRFANA